MATIMPSHSRPTNAAASSSVARRGLSSPPSLLNARLFARLSSGYTQEQKIAELRAAYASPQPANCSANVTPNPRRSAPSRASLPLATLPGGIDLSSISTMMAMENGGSCGRISGANCSSTSSSRRGSAVANCLPTPSIMDLAASAGLLSLSPSDLVFESSILGIAYYDFILSVSEVTGGNGKCSAANSSSCSSSTTIKEQQNSPAKVSGSPSPAKRRVCTTGSEPTAGTAKNSADNEKGAAMVFKGQQQQQQQRPGTSLGIERKSTTASAQSAPAAQSSVELPTQMQLPPSTFSNCNYRLFLAKLDSHTNVEWFESVVVPGDMLERNGIPVNELSLLTMGILVWRSRLANSRLLCLANGQLGEDCTTALEALKRAAGKYKCMHHVLTIGQRRQSASSTHSSCSTSSYRSSSSCGSHGQSQDAGMKLRVLMCQSRNELPEVPSQALRDAKFLMAPSSNPLLCLCFPLT